MVHPRRGPPRGPPGGAFIKNKPRPPGGRRFTFFF